MKGTRKILQNPRGGRIPSHDYLGCTHTKCKKRMKGRKEGNKEERGVSIRPTSHYLYQVELTQETEVVMAEQHCQAKLNSHSICIKRTTEPAIHPFCDYGLPCRQQQTVGYFLLQ